MMMINSNVIVVLINSLKLKGHMWLGWVMRGVGREGGRQGGRVFDILNSYGEDRIWVGKVKEGGD